MTRRIVALALLAGCQPQHLAPPSDGAPEHRLTGEVLRAEGVGTYTHYYAYDLADLSCKTSGGTVPTDCDIDFTLEPADGGGLWVTFEDYHPSNGWPLDDLVEILAGNRVLVTPGVVASGTSGSSWNGWDWELLLDGDELELDVFGQYDGLDRCSGDKRQMACVATFSDPDLGELALPAPVPATPSSPLVIAELLADPTACSDSDGEWVEVANLGPDRIDLTGLRLEDASGRVSDVDGDPVVEPGGVVVLGRGTCDPAVDALLLGSASLNNGGDTLRLLVDGAVVDEVTYAAVGAGVAVARDAVGAWCEADPTPGAPNPDCGAVVGVGDLQPGDLVVSEIMMNPDLVSDDDGEWIEVRNEAGVPVDLAGLEIEDEVGNLGIVQASLVVPPGGYAVLTRNADYGSQPALNNTGDLVVLSSGTQVLDATPVLVPSAGRALQRDDSGAWCEAEATPGAPNVACP